MMMVRRCCSVVLVLSVLIGFSVHIRAEKQPAITPGTRVMELTRIETPPVVDGKLDDACWKKIKPITDFLAYRTNKLADLQSVGYVSYDDSYLYIGMKCLMREGQKPRGRFRDHDSNVFRDDVVEIMIDPGYSKTKYFQLVINAYGATFDCSRGAGGADMDFLWNGDWTGKSHIADDYWSAEMAIPFHNLGIKPGIGSTWGLNLCREDQRFGYSSISINGEFNMADKFAVLKDLNVDFSKYLFEIGPQVVDADLLPGTPKAVLIMPVKNLGGSQQKIKIDIHRDTPESKNKIDSQIITLNPNESVSLTLDELDLIPTQKGARYFYTAKTSPCSKKVVVSRARDGVILSMALIKEISLTLNAMQIKLKDPWCLSMPSGRTTSIPVSVSMSYSKKVLKDMILSADLLSRDTGKVVASETVKGPSDEQKLRFYTRKLPWGAYDVFVKLTNAQGKEVASASSPTTVLPGGKQQIKILNNLVSELMNVKERGLLGQEQITFMNPRNGWCFFSLVGNGRIKLDSEAKPIIVSRSDMVPVEAMRRLSVGKHTLHVIGQPAQIIVRSIPALQHIFKQTCHVHPHGPYDWEFLKKDVRPNINVILGGGNKPELVKTWKKSGRSWSSFSSISKISNFGKGGQSDVDATYKFWSSIYRLPLFDGVIVDEFYGGNMIQQNDPYRKAIEKLNSDFPDKIFMAFTTHDGMRFNKKGSERGHKFAQAVLDGVGYLCPEFYLSEQPTEEQAWRNISEHMVDLAPIWEEALPGCTRRMIITLGYSSLAGWSLNVDPSVNFLVYMDMQVHTLATDPVFFGLGGIQEYLSNYCSGEIIRWTGRLYRHYAIEGNTEPLTKDPYMLTHIRNPDFSDGIDSWTIQPAETGSVQTKRYQGYKKVQGRWPRPAMGDTFLLMKRSDKGPNVFSQQINDLKPGRLYSMAMITADYQDLVQKKSDNKQNGVSIKLDNVEELSGPKKNFQSSYRNNRGKGFPSNNRFWMNYHWRVFRAKGTSARLTVTDWKSEKEPGGPIGQELMFNFIEIQPYIGD